ncbi:MAG TPA: PAS domain-containing sensor histidine kinase [Gammaproteobacteria bacterium]|nr:PAS domain-containing sensor histidine kinase [Gammaproteobacteria bacterium]
MTDTDLLLRLVPEQHKEHTLILLDKKGAIVAWLMGAEKMFGYTKETVLGQNFELLFTPEDRARRIPQGELEVGSKYGRQEDDRWLVRRDGMRIWVSGVLTCLRDSAGKVAGFSKLLRDRTDLKEHMDLLRNKTRALEAENQQKTIMMGTLAHELRNPLGALANATQLIEITYPQDSKLAPTMQLIKRQVRYLSTLIEDLLESVRLQTGKVALQTERTDLYALLASAIENVGAALREKHQRVELILPEPPILLNIDATRLKQVFSNLLSNASKFSGDGTTIWVKAITENDEVSVRVEDQGRGIPPDLLPRLFELFTQGETNSQQSSGLGLGLSIVKQYVELHGGSVQARSEGVGRGSEFIVRLPFQKEELG